MSTQYITFNDVLRKAGFDPDRVLMIRHTFGKELESVKNKDWAETVKVSTACQGKKVARYYDYHRYDYWAVFLATGKGTSSRLFRIYHVIDCLPRTIDMKPEGYPLHDFDDIYLKSGDACYYVLDECDEIADYYDRLVIRWTGNARNWALPAKNRDNPVISIQNKDKRKFPGYDDFILKFSELIDLVNDDSYEDWRIALSSVYGVYLIVDTGTGMQYVGSAYGNDGILGRWKSYADTKHGGDKLLRELLKNDDRAFERFQFTILRILPMTMTKDEVIHIESIFKEKLCTRDFGHNAN